MTFETLLPLNLKTVVREWLKEDTPSFDYGGFVVGDVDLVAVLYQKSDVI
jgi:nicotinate-nucleotide pyrophosphorylase (carboxylating)